MVFYENKIFSGGTFGTNIHVLGVFQALEVDPQ